MPRKPREHCESDIYHVFARGVGRQLVFEDDEDRSFFLKKLGSRLLKEQGDLLAWVLMGNHFHLLVKMPLEKLARFMRSLQTAYVLYFNKKYERVGHLFQSRFGSQPIMNDEQLMACVRYIHRNPVEAGLSETCDYKWSSYRSYLKGGAVTKTDFALEIFGGLKQFKEFHEAWDEERFAFIDADGGESKGSSKRMSDAQANALAVSLLGDDWRDEIAVLSKPERDARIHQLKDAGLSARQIERLTGLSRSLVSRA